MSPEISVVLCTYNRAAMLGGALASLLALDADSPPHEIIVVDNNSPDHTREVVEQFMAQSGGRMRYVFEATQGLSHARNRGIAEARAPLLAFTDDDVRAAPDWLKAIARAFAEHPEVELVGGRVYPIWPSPPPAWLTRENWGPLALYDRGPDGELLVGDPFACIVGANMAFRREVFDRIGGFDPRHQHRRGSVSAVEDHELQLRMYETGGKAWYEPSAVIHAEVQPNRLTRAYHRKWHLDHGRATSRMLPAGHVFDRAGFPQPAPGARRLLGAPLYYYRDGLMAAARTIASAVRLRFGRTFFWANEVREALGGIYQHALDSWHGVDVAGSGPAPRIAAAHGEREVALATSIEQGARGRTLPRGSANGGSAGVRDGQARAVQPAGTLP
ncbi:MAG TPA: glycosyltransferase [Gemmatirosa sp.]|nr:glycosyltransferase [Gemmatirosa sp.]